MQTIIYTNNKRQGSNYEVDRIVFSEKIDVTQLIENEMERYNISHIHFWFIKDNINRMDGQKEDQLLINIGKYLIENKDNNFKFQYIVEKYHENQDRKDKNNDKNRNFKVVNLSESLLEKESSKLEKLQLIRQEIIKEEIKFSHFKEFQIFIKKQLESNLDEEIIKKYLFQTKEQSICISFFQSQQKELVRKIIEQDCNQIYNAKLHYRKISTIHPQDYQKNKKRIESLEQPVQLYHRVILYLFSSADRCEDVRDPKRKKTYKPSNPPNSNLSLEALQPWKIKEEVESLIKYEKECELIKQEIENEKIIFRNKIKIIENYIGDTINVQKLFQEEEEVNTASLLLQQQMSNTLAAPTFKKVPLLAKRSSITPAISQAITNNLEKLSKFNSHNSSFLPMTEFKRLKDISEAMRNIDNTIFEQSKKIEQLKGKAKELQKFKEEVLFKNAKEFNEVRKQILDLNHQIQRKENQILEKKKSGQFQTYLQYKNKQPSELAKDNLKEHIKFISLHQKPKADYHREHLQMKQQDMSNNSLYCKELRELTNSSILKFREKKLKQTSVTVQKLKVQENKRQEISSTKTKTKELNKLSNIFSNQSSQSVSLMSQLTQLYQYFIKNDEIVKLVKKQVSSYKCLNQNDKIMLGKLSNSQQISDKSAFKDPIFSQTLPELNMDLFPILKNALEFENIEEVYASSKDKQNRIEYHIENSFPQDCFEFMINSKKKKATNKVESIHSSLKQTQGERASQIIVTPKVSQHPIMKEPPNGQKMWAKPSKFKRITIQEALCSSALLKKVRPNDNQ